jgi:hypothetical protein
LVREIVGAELEDLDFVVLVAFGGENDDWGLPGGGTRAEL